MQFKSIRSLNSGTVHRDGVSAAQSTQSASTSTQSAPIVSQRVPPVPEYKVAVPPVHGHTFAAKAKKQKQNRFGLINKTMEFLAAQSQVAVQSIECSRAIYHNAKQNKRPHMCYNRQTTTAESNYCKVKLYLPYPRVLAREKGRRIREHTRTLTHSTLDNINCEGSAYQRKSALRPQPYR